MDWLQNAAIEILKQNFLRFNIPTTFKQNFYISQKNIQSTLGLVS